MARFPKTGLVGVAIVVAIGASVAVPVATRRPPRTGPGRASSVPRPSSSPAPTAAPTQPLAFVVHPTRRAVPISWPQARALASGAVADWKALGEQSEPLRFVAGPAGTAQMLRWLGDRPLPAGVRFAGSEREAADEVAHDPGAAGLVAAEVLSPVVRALTLAGADPVRNPDRYPLRTPGMRPAGSVVSAMAFGDILTARTVDKIMLRLDDFTAPFRLVGPRLAAADLAFGNFEGAMSAREVPLHGRVTRFVSRPRALEGLRAAGVDFLSLANNHSGDYGSKVLLETIASLKGAGIATAGAGATDAQAHEPAVVVRRGVRFAFLAFNAIVGGRPATPERPGVATIHMRPWYPIDEADLDRMTADVARARSVADVVIVIPHWGQEYVAVPNADQRRVARALVDAGADLVVGSHPHWVQGAEVWSGGLIAYSLGNFVCDQTWSVETQQGAALELTFWGAKLVAASFVPVGIENAFRPRFLDDDEGAAILRRIWNAGGEPYHRAA